VERKIPHLSQFEGGESDFGQGREFVKVGGLGHSSCGTNSAGCALSSQVPGDRMDVRRYFIV